MGVEVELRFRDRADVLPPDSEVVEVGIFGDMYIRPNRKPAYVANVAAFQEYGTHQIPARPAFRNAVSDLRGREGDAARAYKRGGLAALGELLVQLIRRRIESSPSWARANRPSTIRKKKGDHPLIETGQLLRSITYRVKRKEVGRG